MKLTNSIQTEHPAIESLEHLKSAIDQLQKITSWSDIGILFDKDNKATLVLLLDGSCINGVLRFSLLLNENAEAINLLRRDSGKILLGGYAEKNFTSEQICSLSALNKIWNSITEQTVKVDIPAIEEFLQRARNTLKKTGRGKNFSKETILTVMQDSHGYCMFDGCGQDLMLDELTGKKGNYSYLAHNVASSENGTRGMIVISELLAYSGDGEHQFWPS